MLLVMWPHLWAMQPPSKPPRLALQLLYPQVGSIYIWDYMSVSNFVIYFPDFQFRMGRAADVKWKAILRQSRNAE
jgi:hypothetical protein